MGSFRVAERNAASSRQVQFHWVNLGDSEEVVIPFMQDGTYPPRNFATLGPSELQPPFIWNLISCVNTSSSKTDTGQVSDPIHHFFNFAESCVFTKQSLLPFSWFHSNLSFFSKTGIERSSFSRSYRVNLQSSFKIVISIALVFSTYLPVSVFSTVHQKLFFKLNGLFPSNFIFFQKKIDTLNVILFFSPGLILVNTWFSH